MIFCRQANIEVNSQKSELDNEVTQELHARLMGFIVKSWIDRLKIVMKWRLMRIITTTFSGMMNLPLFCVNVVKHPGL